MRQHFLTTHFEGIEANKHITPPSPSIAAVVRTLHNMDTSFNLENFISNLASLAREPFDPEALPDLLEQVTGHSHRWTRSASTSTSAASASASASAPSVPSAPSASTPHLAAAAVVAAAAAGGGGGGCGDARQE
eukprot:scaffold11050_cov74-Skeletonema_dohrnii-CCMP3373.AAC.1